MPRRPQIDLGKRIAEAIRLQRRRLAAFEKLEERTPEDERLYNAALRVYAAIIAQARALAKDATQWADNLSSEERRAVFVDWFASLPEQQQMSLHRELTRVLNDARKLAQAG